MGLVCFSSPIRCHCLVIVEPVDIAVVVVPATKEQVLSSGKVTPARDFCSKKRKRALKINERWEKKKGDNRDLCLWLTHWLACFQVDRFLMPIIALNRLIFTGRLDSSLPTSYVSLTSRVFWQFWTTSLLLLVYPNVTTKTSRIYITTHNLTSPIRAFFFISFFIYTNIHSYTTRLVI